MILKTYPGTGNLVDFLRRFLIHPILLSIYPILALLAYNISQVYPWMAIRSLFLSVIVCSLLLVIFRVVFKDWHRAGLITSLVLLMGLTYGHIYILFENTTILGINIGRHRFLMGGMVILLAASFTWLVRNAVKTRKKIDRNGIERFYPITQILNFISILLVAFVSVQIAWYMIQNPAQATQLTTEKTNPSSNEDLSTIHLPVDIDGSATTPPDVYYIILDAYGREDTLQTYFNYDNGAFLGDLEALGFFIAGCSQSNYSHTELSVSTSLNMNYLDTLGVSTNNSSVLAELIVHNKVRQSLEKLGYQTIAFESGYSSTEWRDANIYLSPNLHPGKANYLGGINIFEALLLRTSIGILVYEKYDTLPDSIKTQLSATYAEHRSRILYTLDELAKIPGLPGPKLVFAHLLIPHEPFVFGRDGEIVIRKTPFTLNHDPESRDAELYAKGYINQLIYLNARIDALVQKIISESETPPIIILEGDHGPLFRVTSPAARMTNLIAILLPPEGNLSMSDGITLYDKITPVNIFRLIFDKYYGTNLGLINDYSYFSGSNDTFSEIPNNRTDCRP